MRERYKPMFINGDSESLLEIAKSLDIQCEKLKDENDKLLKIIEVSGRMALAIQIVTSYPLKRLAESIPNLEAIVNEYYSLIGGLVNEDSSKITEEG
ncbi:MAG TPA: hypothetical protein VI911_11355 [Patescibacteria group bacterium]|nr:hypothetical protein [Patescibacteria group bacterium]